MSTHGHYAGAAFRCQQRADRETAAQRFRGGKHVRRHAIVHIGVQLPGTADAGLDFIENQQRIVRIAQLTQAAQEFHIRWYDAAFPCIGSTITAQVLSSISAFAESRSLKIAC